MRLLADWQQYLVAVEGKAPATASKYGDFVRALGKRVSDEPERLTFEAIETWLKELFARGYAASSRVIAVEAVKSFARYLCARGVLAVNPTLGLRRPPVHQRERSTLTPAEVQRLVYGTTVGALPSDPLEIRNRTMLWLMYIDGLRVGEPGQLRLDQLAWAEGQEGRMYTILLSGKASTKEVRLPVDLDGSRLLSYYLRERPRIERPELLGRRVVAIRPTIGASPFLFPALGGRALSRYRTWEIFKERFKASGIHAGSREVTPHILRHSIATHLLDVGWTIKEVQEHLRHASINTTALYLHADHARHAARLTRLHPVHSAGKKAAPNINAAMEALRADLGKMG